MKINPNKLEITNVLEIRLFKNKWNKILEKSSKKEITLSWVTRICIKRFLKKQFEWTPKLRKISEVLKQDYKTLRIIPSEQNDVLFTSNNPNKHLHRHMVCLYGDDELGIRIRAAKLGITMTHLVRMALELYLDFLDRKISPKSLVFLGTKKIEIVMDFHDKCTKTFFKENQYWPHKGKPGIIIPIFY